MSAAPPRWASDRLRVLVGGVATVVVAGAAPTGAQAPTPLPTEITAIHFNAGQAVVPYYEGWIRNGDGTFDLVFGYFNRNYRQEFAIPVGPDNKVEPAGLTGGPPTYFLPRRQRFLFRVRVPADFGKKEVVWTLTANGRPERGYGTLQPAQEITERVVMTNGNFDPGHNDPNQAPTITIAPFGPVAANAPVTLTALVTDDGLPKLREAAAPPPARPGAANPFQAQIARSDAPRPRALNVTWLQYGGPAKVVFGHTEPILVRDGQAVTTARFPAPGSYTLIATATDPGRLGTKTTVVVTVPASPSSSGQP